MASWRPPFHWDHYWWHVHTEGSGFTFISLSWFGPSSETSPSSHSQQWLCSAAQWVWTSKANRPAEQSVHQLRRGSSKCPTLLCNRDVKQNILQVRFGSFVSGCRNELWCSHLHLSVFTIVQKVFYSKFTACVKVFMCTILNSFFLNELLLANVPNMIFKPSPQSGHKGDYFIINKFSFLDHSRAIFYQEVFSRCTEEGKDLKALPPAGYQKYLLSQSFTACLFNEVVRWKLKKVLNSPLIQVQRQTRPQTQQRRLISAESPGSVPGLPPINTSNGSCWGGGASVSLPHHPRSLTLTPTISFSPHSLKKSAASPSHRHCAHLSASCSRPCCLYWSERALLHSGVKAGRF